MFAGEKGEKSETGEKGRGLEVGGALRFRLEAVGRNQRSEGRNQRSEDGIGLLEN